MAKKTSGSAPGEINKEDLRKVGKGALIALAGAAITILADIVPGVDFGKYQVLVAALSAVIVNLLRVYISNNK